MICAVVGREGVGRSTLAYELAAARGGVAVDAACGVSGLPRGPGPDLHDVAAGRAAVHEAIRGGPVSVLPCGRPLAGTGSLDPTRLADLLRAVPRDVILDTPVGRPECALRVASVAVCVTTPGRSPRAVRHACRRARSHDADCVVVRNRVPPEVAGPGAGEPAHTVPESPHLAVSLPAERPAVTARPASAAASAIRSLDDRLGR